MKVLRWKMIGTHLLEALFGLPMEPLVLLADLDTARGHTGTHGWGMVGKKERKGWVGKEKGGKKSLVCREGVRSRGYRKIKWNGGDGNR